MGPQPRPHVLIVGGFLTEPLLYRALRERLLARDAASVAIAPVHIIDWVGAGMVGLGPLLVRAGLAIRRTHRLTGRAPLLVVGHSGGGIVARLALSPQPYHGRRAGVADAVGCLVTLGTPHGLARARLWRTHPGVEAATFLDRVAGVHPPDPGTAVVTVGSTAIGPSAWEGAPLMARLRNAPYRLVVGPVGPAGGDGIVGVDLAHLPGARQVTLPDATHGTFGTRWYGDEAVIDRWWSVALEAWRGAVDARSRANSPSGDAAPGSPDQSEPGSAPSAAAVPAVPVTFRGG